MQLKIFHKVDMPRTKSWDLRAYKAQSWGVINPISDRLWYDVIRRGRAIVAQPDFLLYNSAKSGTNTQNLFPDKIFDI